MSKVVVRYEPAEYTLLDEQLHDEESWIDFLAAKEAGGLAEGLDVHLSDVDGPEYTVWQVNDDGTEERLNV